jgi:hypothetical protein
MHQLGNETQNYAGIRLVCQKNVSGTGNFSLGNRLFYTHLPMKHLFTFLLVLTSTLLWAQDDSLADDSTDYKTRAEYAYRVHHFFLDIDAGFGTAHHTIFGNHYQELADCRHEHEKDIYIPTARVSLGYKLRHWWSVSIGLQYFETGFDFSEEKQLSDTLPSEFSIGCDVYQAVDPYRGFIRYAFFDPRFVSGIQGYHPSQATLNIRERYKYIGLPIQTELSTELHINSRGRTILFVNGGVTPNYMLKQEYDMSFSNESWNYVVQDSVGVPAPFVRRWNMMSSFGVGFTVIIRERYELKFEASNQYQLFYFFNWRLWGNYDYQEKHNISTLKVSFRYYLGDI